MQPALVTRGWRSRMTLCGQNPTFCSLTAAVLSQSFLPQHLYTKAIGCSLVGLKKTSSLRTDTFIVTLAVGVHLRAFQLRPDFPSLTVSIHAKDTPHLMTFILERF